MFPACFFLIFGIFAAAEAAPDPCVNYKVIVSHDQWRNRRDFVYYGDRCFSSNGVTWYRILGSGGSEISTRCGGKLTCRTYGTGWIKGNLPGKDKTAKLKLCYNYYAGCCSYSRDIEVKNCGGFYIYKFGRRCRIDAHPDWHVTGDGCCQSGYKKAFCTAGGATLTNPCQIHSGGCEGNCSYDAGSVKCSCPNPEMVLSSNGRDCECKEGKKGPDGKCVKPMPAECSSYNTITTQGNWKTSASYGFRCFSGNGKTWFRLEGAGGTKIVNSCPPSMKCNTYGSGWIKGNLPSANKSVDLKLCYSYTSGCCSYARRISVTNCNGMYYVYKFGPRCWVDAHPDWPVIGDGCCQSGYRKAFCTE